MRPVQLPDGTVIDGNQICTVYDTGNQIRCTLTTGITFPLEPVNSDPHAQIRDWAARLTGHTPKRPIARTR